MTTVNHKTAIDNDKESQQPTAAAVTAHAGADEVENTVNRLISEKLGLDETQINAGASFSDDLGIDSLDVFELIIEIENVFGINIPEEEGEKLTNPGTLITYIKNHTK